MTHFKTRNGLKQPKCHGEAGSADPEKIERERWHVQQLIKKYGYELRDIFNVDYFMGMYHFVGVIISLTSMIGSHQIEDW